MTKSALVIADIVNEHNEDNRELFFRLIQNIRLHSKDRNAENYYSLDEDYKNYPCFQIAKLDNKIVSFAGLDCSKFPKKTGRAMNKLYFTPDVREDGLKMLFRPRVYKTRTVGALSFYKILEKQMLFAVQLKLSSIFMSVEFSRRRSMLLELTKRINSYIPFQYKWQMLNKLYLTCDDAPHQKNCWQNISFLNFDQNCTFPLECMSHEEWKNKFLHPIRQSDQPQFIRPLE